MLYMYRYVTLKANKFCKDKFSLILTYNMQADQLTDRTADQPTD